MSQMTVHSVTANSTFILSILLQILRSGILVSNIVNGYHHHGMHHKMHKFLVKIRNFLN